MRLRNVRGSKEKIEEYEFAINEPEILKGKWREEFGNDNPIHIEIGMGKGKFISTLAQTNPNINYIGIEKFSSVLVRAIQKQEQRQAPLENLRFIRFDAEKIREIFEDKEIDRIYLNFSDPWPKEKHAKRRLTSKQFLEKYKYVMNDEATIIFKTDNRDLFDFSLEQVKECGWNLLNYTFDLHNSEYLDGNVMTEYETKFVGMGIHINRLECSKPSNE